MRFEFEDSFWSGSFYCILEWDKGSDGHLILFKRLGDIWIEKSINYLKIENIIKLLNEYDFFNRSLFENFTGLDGYTIGLEVKYENNYKELGIWGIRNGILYDVGMLLIQFADTTFKELYEYAW